MTLSLTNDFNVDSENYCITILQKNKEFSQDCSGDSSSNKNDEMDKDEVLKLVCDSTFRTLVREDKSIQRYFEENNKQTIEKAKRLVRFLDKQQTTFSQKAVQQKYNAVLHKILFNS